MAMSQREAVYRAVSIVLPDEVKKGYVDIKALTKPQKDMIHTIVVEMFIQGEVELRDESNRNHEYLKGYVPGLVNNWLRKDKKLNGNVKYEPKNPGIRAGSGDEQLQALKALLSNVKDTDLRKQVETEIKNREKQLEEKKMKAVNIDALPAHLREIALRVAPKVIKKSEPESNIIEVEPDTEVA